MSVRVPTPSGMQSDDWTIKGGVSRGYKTPRVEQLVNGIIGFTAQGRTATIGTPTLRPETSTTTELSATYAARSGIRAGVTVFNNDFRDKIATGTPVPNCTFRQNPDAPGCVTHGEFPTQEFFAQSINVDRAQTYGAEVSAHVKLFEVMAVSGNYTHTRSEQKSGDNAGMPLSNTPRHMLNAELRATPVEKLNAWARTEYRSERARRTTKAANPAWEALGDFRGYTLAHIGAGYDLGRGIAINATLQNVFDKDFLRYESYTVEPTTANPSGVVHTNVYNNHQEGRRLWLSTTFQF
jgi:outer membrane receptor for ferrienterochelin and colicins